MIFTTKIYSFGWDEINFLLIVFNMFWEVMVCPPMGLYTYLSVFNFFFPIFWFMDKGPIGTWQCAVHIEWMLLQNDSSIYRESKVWSAWIWLMLFFYDFSLVNIEWCEKGNEFPSKVYCRFTILFMISGQHAIGGQIPNPTI